MLLGIGRIHSIAILLSWAHSKSGIMLVMVTFTGWTNQKLMASLVKWILAACHLENVVVVHVVRTLELVERFLAAKLKQYVSHMKIWGYLDLRFDNLLQRITLNLSGRYRFSWALTYTFLVQFCWLKYQMFLFML